MKKHLLSSWFLTGCWFILGITNVFAAPPTLNYLFPAGGQRGTTVQVIASGTFDRWPPHVWIDGKGIEVKPAKETGKLDVAIAADAVPGTYWMRCFNQDGASVARPFIVGTLPEVLEQEPNDDPHKPQVLKATQVIVNGRLEKPGDVDTFALDLNKGQTLVASLEARQTLRSPMDGVLQILSADGFVLEQNDDYHGWDPQIVFPVPKDGRYLVRAYAFPSEPDSSIRFAGGDKFVYRLTLTTGPFVDYAFPLAVERAKPGAVELVGWNIPEKWRTFALPATPSLDPWPVFHPELANVFPVRLEPHPVLVKTAKNPQAVVLPVTVCGRLEKPRDVDVYQFQAKKGDRLTFAIDAGTLGFPLDPVLKFTDAAGKLLSQAKTDALAADPNLDVTIAQDGAYRLEIHDLHGDGSRRHVYRLRAAPTQADFGLTVATDRFVLTPGKPLDIPVTVEPRHGFSGPVDLRVDGLPKGVMAILLPADKAAKGPILRLTGEAMSFSGPIRILGTPKDKAGPVRIARATVTDLMSTTEQCWLTVAAKK